MVFSHTFTSISKRASQKAPSFFDSAYHLRNYTQLATPELFTSNTSKENKNGGGNNTPKYQYGIYSYNLLLDPYTSSLIYHSHNNNNNNNGPNGNGIGSKNSSNPYNNIDEEFIATNNATSVPPVSNKFLQTISTRSHPTALGIPKSLDNSHNASLIHHHTPAAATPHFSVPSVLNKSKVLKTDLLLLGHQQPQQLLLVNSKRSYATVAENSDEFVSKNKIHKPTSATKKPIASKELPIESSSAASQKGHKIESALKQRFLSSLDDEIKTADDSLKLNLLIAMKDCVKKDDMLKVFPLYQAIKRNELNVSVPIYNLVLYSTSVREIPGESIESKLTTILNIYSDIISLHLKPDLQTYETVLDSLLAGAFKSYHLFLNNKSIEVTIDDDGSVVRKPIERGSNYFRLALEIFLASNFARHQDFSSPIYDSLVTGLNVFNYRFKDTNTFSKFLMVLDKSKNLKKNDIYYINLIRYGVHLSVTESSNKDQTSNAIAKQFVLDMYNRFKNSSDNDTSLLVQQFNVYSVLLHSLCQLNYVRLATSILDSLLLSMKNGDNKLAFTGALENASHESRSVSPASSTSSIDSLFSDAESVSRTTSRTSVHSGNSKTSQQRNIKVNQTGELNKVIIFYLSAMIDVNLSKSIELFEKFSSFGLINVKDNSKLNNQFLVNVLVKSCEINEFETADYIFNKYIANNERIFDGHSLVSDHNQQFKMATSSDKIRLLLHSLIRSSPTSILENESNSLHKALSLFLRTSIQANNIKNIVPYIEFEDGSLELTARSQKLLKYLQEDAVGELLNFMATYNYPFAPQIMNVIGCVNDLNGDGFDRNRVLTQLCNMGAFTDLLNEAAVDGEQGAAKPNVFKLVKSKFFTKCNQDFALKQYVTECEKSVFNANKYFGLFGIWYGFWNVQPSLAGSITEDEQVIIANNQNILSGEFNNLDNFYLQKNINNELMENLQNHEKFRQLGDAEKSFYSQLNVLSQFEHTLIAQ